MISWSFKSENHNLIDKKRQAKCGCRKDRLLELNARIDFVKQPSMEAMAAPFSFISFNSRD
jgi:hypothetical protein